MDPSEAEVKSWVTIADVCDFVKLPKEYDMAYSESVRGSLLACFGLAEDAPWEPFGMIDEDAWAAAIASWKVEGAQPSLILRSIGGSLGRACRIGVGTELRRSEKRDFELKKAEVEAKGKALGDAQAAAMAPSPIGHGASKGLVGAVAAVGPGAPPNEALTPKGNVTPQGNLGHFPFPGGFVPPARLPLTAGARGGVTRARAVTARTRIRYRGMQGYRRRSRGK